MPKTVVLHIGSPKTGTTSLQKHLRWERDQLAALGVYYPRKGRKLPWSGHHNLVYELATGPKSAFEPRDGGWADTLAEFERSGLDTLVISTEAFFRLPMPQMEKIAGLLKDFDVRVVMYLRKQDEYFESAYNQLARFGRVQGSAFDMFEAKPILGRYNEILARWAKLYGQDAISAYHFCQAEVQGDISAHFVRKVLGGAFRTPEGANANTSVPMPIVRMIQEIQARVQAVRGSDWSIHASQVSRITQELTRDGQEKSTSLSVEQADAIMAHYEKINEVINARYFARSGSVPFERSVDPKRYRPLPADFAFDAEAESYMAAQVRELLEAPVIDRAAELDIRAARRKLKREARQKRRSLAARVLGQAE